ncbi:hypothetical protein CCICO_08305 [Corynebacterium ciconiae DSM 44920]|uniref:DUF1707 SHOCT-like domain-containing protein n=1 Tax=Corynebacterium ciconiae TaxID=227319 RepID=UPI000373301F|nr:DUF1707 domain-containing protein [Corynebacterium ciconiae]WKD61676.1 hypothetical protein CCICO_08305 [Corynebacterium ciconiae DSM 44920]
MTHATPSDGQPPRLRASDHDRSRVLDHLAQAYADGRLDYSEFDERSTQASTSRFIDELGPLIADLGGYHQHGLGPHPSLQPASSPAHEGAPARPAESGDAARAAMDRVNQRVIGGTGAAQSFSLCGANSFSGGSTLASQHDTVVVFSGSTFDLRSTPLVSAHTTITVNVMFGGCEIIVPEGMRVIMNPTTVLGDCSLKVKNKVQINPATLPAHAPSVTINGFVLCGSCEVVVAPDRH